MNPISGQERNNLQQLTSDKQLAELFSKFLKTAVSAAVKNPEERQKLLQLGGFRLSSGLLFNTDKVLSEERSLIDRVVILIGPTFVHEEDVERLIWSYVDKAVCQDNESVFQKLFLSFAGEAAKWRSEPIRYLLPNSVVQSAGGLPIELGPIKLRSISDLISEFAEVLVDDKANIAAGKLGNVDWSSEIRTYYISASCWDVTLPASPSIKEESALWLIDVAVSLIRLMLYNNPAQAVPLIGQVEVKSGALPLYTSGGISISSAGVAGGGKSTLGVYRIDLSDCDESTTSMLRTCGSQVFNAKSGSVAERIQQGLGWLTRSRTTHDRPERLLYLFTAVEALLSTNDKTAPITQTISRHAAVILSNDPRARQKIARIFTSLYAVRSKLVHSGKREVSSTTSNNAQILIEKLYITVLNVCSIEMTHQDFCSELANASYGTVWPEQPT